MWSLLWDWACHLAVVGIWAYGLLIASVVFGPDEWMDRWI